MEYRNGRGGAIVISFCEAHTARWNQVLYFSALQEKLANLINLASHYYFEHDALECEFNYVHGHQNENLDHVTVSAALDNRIVSWSAATGVQRAFQVQDCGP